MRNCRGDSQIEVFSEARSEFLANFFDLKLELICPFVYEDLKGLLDSKTFTEEQIQEGYVRYITEYQIPDNILNPLVELTGLDIGKKLEDAIKEFATRRIITYCHWRHCIESVK